MLVYYLKINLIDNIQKIKINNSWFIEELTVKRALAEDLLQLKSKIILNYVY